MIAEINIKDGIILINYEEHDRVRWTKGPFTDTVWQRWHRKFEKKGRPPTDDCYWMILE